MVLLYIQFFHETLDKVSTLMPKILVTGGCGFIGANLVPMLMEKGYHVRILDNLSKGSKEYIKDSNVNIQEGDIRDETIVSNALIGIDVVIHLAAYGSVVESVLDPVENFDINTKGTFTVLNACRKANIKQVIFSSTGGALIGNAKPPVNEQSVPKPISPYGSSKLCCEAYCSSFSSSYDMNITALRFANVIGPISSHKKGAVTAFMKAIINNIPIQIYGDGKATRDFLFVTDLCSGIIKALDKKLPGFNPIHLASGREVSVTELAKLIISIAGKSDHSINYHDKRIGEVERNFANYDLAKELLEFEPEHSLEDGLKKTWLWFLNENSKNENT